MKWWLALMLGLSACGARPAATAHREVGVEGWMLDAQAATTAYVEKRYSDCTSLSLRASEHASGRAKADAFVSAAGCELKAGHRAEAIALFRKGLETSASYCDDTIENANLQRELADDPQWASFVTEFKPACAAYLNSINGELRDIYHADQDDRRAAPEKIDWKVVNPRDAARRERVRQLEAAKQLRTADDYYHAAMVFQHGIDESSHATAFHFARHAVELDSNFVKARWLVAASRDRYHMSRLEPQLYGTQYKIINGIWIVWPADHHITDRDRATWCVQSLETAKQSVARMNAKSP
ncbi:hypothetical protein LZC95_01690 [Pendulispora brunnea]|uniref:Uncharacterized protein n=1 Tax=Pendulispora brunnea TaxID=2905690 RepID=A0ABZ2KBU7_9BACT